MTIKNMFDASLYNISVRKGHFDGEVFYQAKVKELPDVAEYADSHEEAYLLAIDTIETTAEAFTEQGRVMPLPMTENDEYSGRVTLRMPKSTHAAMAHWAQDEDISLNQLMVNCLSFSLGHQFGMQQK
jgi:predicted HicB family RNase H-like nuclease